MKMGNRCPCKDVLPSTALCEILDQIEEALWRVTISMITGTRASFRVGDSYADGVAHARALRDGLVDARGARACQASPRVSTFGTKQERAAYSTGDSLATLSSASFSVVIAVLVADVRLRLLCLRLGPRA